VSIDTVIKALEPHGVKRSGTGWASRCPGHEDAIASLSVSQGANGRVLLYCQAGCELADILEGAELTQSDMFTNHETSGPRQSRIVAEHDYWDENGDLLYQVVRFEPKDFRQRRPDGHGGWVWGLGDVRRVPYGLPELLDAPTTATVWIPEGEKDVDALRARGLIATTNLGGAGKGKWRPEYCEPLRGRKVVLLPDNDEVGRAHATAVAAMLDGIAESVRILELPGLPPKGDISDWLANADNTVERLQGLANGQGNAFQTATDRLAGERDYRVGMSNQVLSFGVSYLDHALGGIVPNDLVLFGAKTGVGKTALATITALHNCQAGKRVHYFALEAEESEIERRMKFQVVSQLYYKSAGEKRPIRYLDWYMGKLDRELAQFDREADKILASKLGDLFTFYKFDSFTSDEFCRRVDAVKDSSDLVILDHLHYVDSDDENENRGYKRIVKQIRDVALRTGRPIIVVAHVRKGDRRFEPLIPGIEDFHGSSDIAKIATKAVMLAPAYDKPTGKSYLWNTYVQVVKCRLDSSVTRYAALVTFNTRENTYDENYLLGRLADQGKTFQYLTGEDMPSWSRARAFDE
jgi:hypothetical protein